MWPVGEVGHVPQRGSVPLNTGWTYLPKRLLSQISVCSAYHVDHLKGKATDFSHQGIAHSVGVLRPNRPLFPLAYSEVLSEYTTLYPLCR